MSLINRNSISECHRNVHLSDIFHWRREAPYFSDIAGKLAQVDVRSQNDIAGRNLSEVLDFHFTDEEQNPKT